MVNDFIRTVDSSGAVVNASYNAVHMTCGVRKRYYHPLQIVYAALHKSNQITAGPLALCFAVQSLNQRASSPHLSYSANAPIISTRAVQSVINTH